MKKVMKIMHIKACQSFVYFSIFAIYFNCVKHTIFFWGLVI